MPYLAQDVKLGKAEKAPKKVGKRKLAADGEQDWATCTFQPQVCVERS